MNRKLFLLALGSGLAAPAAAQFTGPTATVPAPMVTVAELAGTPLGSYVTVAGTIVARERGNYYLFRDDTGEIRVEIEDAVFDRRPVGPDTPVRLSGEIDAATAGRYLWVRSLAIEG
jgi:uncharacterized protein (TIGR00156 family)